ncbi:MAG: hypothetical protein QF886_25485, partial [Planctomycetota bacterium]|nr:hypothetical protein [Planctomycetota bacterium]
MKERSLRPGPPRLYETPLGSAVEIRSRARNLLSRELSVGLSTDGISSAEPLGVIDAEGFVGEGCLEWKPNKRGDFIEFELPEVCPTEYLSSSGTGIFVAMCLSMQVQTDVALNLSMLGQTENQSQATPGFAAANPEWQRINVALRALDTDLPTARLSAQGAGRVRMDALQFEPRAYPVWMTTEPMRTGMWGAWTEGGTERKDDQLWCELDRSDVPSSGAITAWFQPDWPSSDYPHTIFDAGFENLFFAFHNARILAAAGGTQVGLIDKAQDWRFMIRLEPGLWHQAGLTWNEAGEVALFIDGECYSRRRSPNGIRLDSSATRRMFIGCPSQEDGYQENPDMPGCFDGLIADLRIHSSPLDDAEMAVLHLDGRNRLETPVGDLVTFD